MVEVGVSPVCSQSLSCTGVCLAGPLVCLSSLPHPPIQGGPDTESALLLALTE